MKPLLFLALLAINIIYIKPFALGNPSYWVEIKLSDFTNNPEYQAAFQQAVADVVSEEQSS